MVHRPDWLNLEFEPQSVPATLLHFNSKQWRYLLWGPCPVTCALPSSHYLAPLTAGYVNGCGNHSTFTASCLSASCYVLSHCDYAAAGLLWLVNVLQMGYCIVSPILYTHSAFSFFSAPHFVHPPLLPGLHSRFTPPRYMISLTGISHRQFNLLHPLLTTLSHVASCSGEISPITLLSLSFVLAPSHSLLPVYRLVRAPYAEAREWTWLPSLCLVLHYSPHSHSLLQPIPHIGTLPSIPIHLFSAL